MKRYVMLCEGAFDEDAKTATGVLRYADAETLAIIDSTRAGSTSDEHVPGLDARVPIVATLDEALLRMPDTLLVGVAPAGGKLPPVFKSIVADALRSGLDVEAGLHDYLGNDPDLVAAAAEGGAEIRDLRRPPADLNVPTLENLSVDAFTVLAVGSDCALGKMTVCLELDREARRRGVASQFVPTGQTGIAIAGWGIAVDEVISDYVAGAAERLVLEGHGRAGDGAVLWIEGQGAVNHPFYSGVTTGLMHGSAPHALLFVHEPGRTLIDGDPRLEIAPIEELIEMNERMAAMIRPAPVVALALKTNRLDDAAARAAIEEYAARTGLVTDDPVRYGAGRLVDAVLAARPA